jgi:hypothetical protein
MKALHLKLDFVLMDLFYLLEMVHVITFTI